MKTSIVGFPRIGEHRELKFQTEKYFRQEISEEELLTFAKALRQKHWQTIKQAGIEEIPSNDFSFYDQTLDTAVLFNIIPEEVAKLPFTDLERYFALARGYQGEKGDVKARPMKKWFNTNYHYLVPKFEKNTQVKLTGRKIFAEYQEAKALGIQTRPVLVGPFTLLSLAEYEAGCVAEDFVPDLIQSYREVLLELAKLGAQWVQLDEPALVKDLAEKEKALLTTLYQALLEENLGIKVLVQTYFGDVRDVYEILTHLPIDGLGLDFVEGKETLRLVQSGFPKDKILYAGIVNGKNIWRNDYTKTVELIKQLPVEQLVLTTSCSLLHVPYTVENETFAADITAHLAFAKEKLGELVDLATILTSKHQIEQLIQNQTLFANNRIEKNLKVQQAVDALQPNDFIRQPAFAQREKLQKAKFQFPLLPTTTIGSFPQTKEVKQKRAQFNRGDITEQAYEAFVQAKINEWLAWQSEIGLDVLVHGEFERNDMVEYFGQNLAGYLFSQNGWVQSYGTRGVKPPIIWGDIYRKAPITVKWSSYAQQQTKQYVKGMLTGPVTILNWSFPREDISLRESTLQLALAIQEEVLDLEANGIEIIQIDEAALREKLPLRQSDWFSEYLDWAIPAFRLVHSKVKPTTQIHTHMCYSEFTDIIEAIDAMDADVISFEASRSNLTILDELQAKHFQTQVGPGVYDIHSPRIPSVAEITETITKILSKVPKEKVWINPDCGLKTRGEKETKASLQHLTQAARLVREELTSDE
ncbi:5-methyltetrahydropteroyltriglutamate--homocysteine S-methyltransferase [Enterococcus columbae]|uniref:5-methyltetrahydropteroyltriglutamate--homocysteine methyltransferase n=1 Tax=Enterococcus columbae DSM 7374 = ATCC 51263 TaxID=1121865 RepID=S0KHU6_9ENTE|nr:5-methyltetrahydropteroyltriglutamate--homocysteine S-methyltransferase [Enterococcus columbae]EOT40515.1 5-methyltetrahydropteroyltriglutamate-homocysteine S-methyltransferase [Enterococcus columbae DSM 7374 = ATCC 51263]EOW80291.1 5-methyltetrahydropteroyltriglutamate-homocysteine S-methyltransferase [Enterococcus columbae DSM 7374 = ATCC 51263]OJG25551.1 5-methyltetrahydropteroyltriglutamate-homocysteine S-methyltransferase [Enterococcus columbae DSM 7374 = ATCC 51263]